jgi:hypothetical protein
MSVRPSDGPPARKDTAPTGRILLNFISDNFLKIVQKIQDSFQSDKNNGYFALRPVYIFNHISRNYLNEIMFHTNCVEEIKTYILRSVTFFPKIASFFFFIMWKKYFRARQTADVNMTHAHCML